MQHPFVDYIIHEQLLTELLVPLPILLLLGLVGICIFVISYGADVLISGVVNMAQRSGISKVVIGATIVSLGTTMPEAFVSVMAAILGNPGLALGNGVGSIIADTGLIFGLTCLLSNVPVNRYILNRTGWWQVGAPTFLVVIAVGSYLATSGNPTLGRVTGLALLSLLAVYLFMTFVWAKNSGADEFRESTSEVEKTSPMLLNWAMILWGLLLVLVSARILIPTASAIAVKFKVPNDIIAATLVAFGTSLPELTTAIASVKRGHPEIAVGNVVGADVLNCLFVIGAAATASNMSIPTNFYLFHFPVMMIVLWSFRFFIYKNKFTFRRWQGAYLLAIYLMYIGLQYGMDFA